MKPSSAIASLTIIVIVGFAVVRPDIVFWVILSGCFLGFIGFTHHFLTDLFDSFLPDRFRR
jgi:hypothetical protein